MKKLVIMTLLVGTSTLVQAQDSGQGHSIMYQNSQDDRSDLTTLPPGHAQDRGEKCMQMMHEVDQLKGKPQRRSVAMERYKQECEMR
jgi:hypothetical protein